MSRLLVVAAATVGALVIPAGAAQAAAPNQRPTVPSRLSVSGVACGDAGIFIGTTTPEFTAFLDDPDFSAARVDEVTPTFALWPVGQRDRRTEWTGTPQTYSSLTRSKPAAALTDGVRYRLEVRATDAAGARSRWSACTFTVDTKVPHAPTVTSADYPSTGAAGGQGISGRFTFAVAGGDTDVAAFRWSASGVGLTETPVDGSGKVTVEYTPIRPGSNYIEVQAVDRTRNRSAVTRYDFVARDTAPRLTDLTPDVLPGEPRTFQVAPGDLGGLVSYEYRLNDEAATTIAAATDGTATFVVRPTRPGVNTLSVSGRTASGQRTAEVSRTINLVYPEPTVTSPDFPAEGGTPPLVGREVTLVFHPGAPGVTEYVWSVNSDGADQVAVAGPDGTATVRYTTRSPALWLQVRSRTSGGIESPTVMLSWELISHAPVVSSPQYPLYGSGSGPGTFTFAPAHEGVTGYEYSFDAGPVQTVEGETATIDWTPETSGWVTLTVRERIGDIVSDPTLHEFTVN